MLYIKFAIEDPAKFEDLKEIYQTIAPLKNAAKQKPLDFWMALIPDYVKVFYRMKKMDAPNQNFKQMVRYLQQDLEVQFDGLEELAEGRGRMDFSTGNYPYGGMDRLMVFLKSFDAVAVEIYNGFEVNDVIWDSKFRFSCQEKID